MKEKDVHVMHIAKQRKIIAFVAVVLDTEEMEKIVMVCCCSLLCGLSKSNYSTY